MVERTIPWPRIGQVVTLKSGHKGEVITIDRGADALRAKTELQILEMAPSMHTAIGPDWMNNYYEATIQLVHNAKLVVVTPREVLSTADPD